MKFKDLPEGCYIVHRIGNPVCVEKTEAPTEYPIHLDVSLIEVVHDGREYRQFGNDLTEQEVEFKTHAEVKKERKAYGAKLGHVTRYLNDKKPMIGKVLETALSLVTCDDPAAGINKDPSSKPLPRR